jgi:hypothetical protein
MIPPALETDAAATQQDELMTSTFDGTHDLLDDASLSEIILQSNLGQKFVDVPWETTVDSILDNAILDVGEPCIATPNCALTPGNGTALFDEMNQFSNFYQSYVGSPAVEMFLSSRGRLGTLAPLRIRNPMAQHTAGIILQSLRTFPWKMLSREDPPFFIHSYQHRNALPEPLAACSRICHMFDTRTPEILPFIWRCIRTEEMRFLNEVWRTLSLVLLSC